MEDNIQLVFERWELSKVRSGKYDGGNSISRQVERGGNSEQVEDEELIGDEWVDL